MKYFKTSDRVLMSDPPPLEKVVRHWYDVDGRIGHTVTRYY